MTDCVLRWKAIDDGILLLFAFPSSDRRCCCCDCLKSRFGFDHCRRLPVEKIAEQLVPTSVERILDLFFVYFQSFQSNNTIFKANQCEKCPSSIWALDLNPRPLEHELSNITTRPGLTVFFINKYMKSRAFKGTYSWRQYPGLDPQEWKNVYVKKLSSWWQIFLQK